jgi:dihydropyrimidinase
VGVLIRGGRVIDVAGDRQADLRVNQDGRVGEVAAGLPLREHEEVYDATGKLVVPGGVDPHTHMGLPVGTLRVSDDFASGTRAAALGGTTTIIDFVNVVRGADPMAAVAEWQRAAEPSAIDWGLHLTFTEGVPEAVVAAAAQAGITSFKLYLAYPERLQVDDGTVLRLMKYARRQGVLVALHCENGAAIEELRREALAAGRTAVVEHARTRPPALEGEAVARAAVLAELAGAPIYIVHVSSADALAAVRAARRRGIDVQAETCPQYLYLNTAKLEGPDAADFVCTPPLREPRHSDALWEGLAEGDIQTVGTDHCPFWQADRRAGVTGRLGADGRPEGARDFSEVPGGLPGVETRMALMWAAVRAGRMGATDWIRLCCEAPARIFGLWPAKGSLAEGADADIVVWAPERAQPLTAGRLHMATDHSPYEDIVSVGWPELVLSRGRVVVRDGQFCGEPGWGRFLARAPRPAR